MEKTKAMSSSKKLTVAVVAMAVALLAVVGGLIGVWAATTQTASSQFDVQYDISGHLAGSIAANYQLKNAEGENVGDAVDMGTTVEFNVTEDDKKAALNATDEIGLSATNKTVVFTYTFTNAGEQAYTATLTDTCALKNVTVTYGGLTNKAVEVPAATQSGETTTPSTVSVTITVTIIDTNFSANYTSTADAGISWVLA